MNNLKWTLCILPRAGGFSRVRPNLRSSVCTEDPQKRAYGTKPNETTPISPVDGNSRPKRVVNIMIWPRQEVYVPISAEDHAWRESIHGPLEPLTIDSSTNPREIKVQSRKRGSSWVSVKVIKALHTTEDGRHHSRVWYTYPGNEPTDEDFKAQWPLYSLKADFTLRKPHTAHHYRYLRDENDLGVAPGEGIVKAQERFDVWGRRYWKESRKYLLPNGTHSTSDLLKPISRNRSDNWPFHPGMLAEEIPAVDSTLQRRKPAEHHGHEVHHVEVQSIGQTRHWVSVKVIATRLSLPNGRIVRMWYTFAGDEPCAADYDCAWPSSSRIRYSRFFRDHTPLADDAYYVRVGRMTRVSDKYRVTETMWHGRRFWKELSRERFGKSSIDQEAPAKAVKKRTAQATQ